MDTVRAGRIAIEVDCHRTDRNQRSWRLGISRGVAVLCVVGFLVGHVVALDSSNDSGAARHMTASHMSRSLLTANASYLPTYTGIDPWLVNGLGPIWWEPSSNTTDAANSYFSIGLRMLHLFWYDEGMAMFKLAIEADPGFWGGYWGVMMTRKQQLWQTEDPIIATQYLDLMQTNVRFSELTAREITYMNAVRAMWAANQTMEQREKAYSSVMLALHESLPDDVDSCAFYALSLMCMVANSANYLNSTEVAQANNVSRTTLNACLGRWGDHAGLLHYTVHSYDVPDPDEVTLGLVAGVKLSDEVPAASHAQHMKSHLFLQIGNWSEVVDSNVLSVAAADYFCMNISTTNTNGTLLRACDADDKYHSLEWWMYGLTQQCAFRDATALLGRMMEVWTYTQSMPFNQWALRMWSHIVVQSQGAALLPLVSPLQLGSPLTQPQQVLQGVIAMANMTLPNTTDIYWELHARSSALVAGAYALTLNTNTTGYASTNGSTTQTLIASLSNTLVRLTASVPPDMQSIKGILAVYTMQMSALQMVSSCVYANATNCTGWMELMDQALINETAIWGQGPSLNIAPVTEMYGHLLLFTLNMQPNKTAAISKALEQFNVCLTRLYNRQSCMLGIARAAAAAGAVTQANMWYGEVWQQCAPWAAPADFLWPGLVEAWWMLTPLADMTQTAAKEQYPSKLFSAYHEYLYTYGSTNVYLNISTMTYQPPATGFQAAIAARLPPYPAPADLDPGNKPGGNSSAPPSYPYLGLTLSSGVAGYPAGQVVFNGSYSFVEQRNGTEFWPPFGGLYTDMLRAARKG